MTPADIMNKKFDKGMGGYKTEEVHEFLDQVAAYVTDLEEEKGELLDKMEILADKLEQYREDEESLRAALIGAQKLGNSVVREAQRKAEAIISQAVHKAEDIVGDAQKNIDNEALALKKMQRGVAEFREKIIRLYTEHLEMIQSLPEIDDLPQIEMAQIDYSPPDFQDVSEELNIRAPKADPAEEEEEQLRFAMVGGDSQEEHSDTAGYKHKMRREFEQLNQFFGEDKPIERN